MRVAILVFVLSGSTVPAMAQDVSAVTQASQKFAAAMSSGDASAASALFADDASVLPPGRGALTGRPQVQMFLNNLARNVQDLRYASETIKPLGDSGAREVGSVSFKTKPRNGKSPQDVAGKYLIVWEKTGGDWKISADMWNRSAGGPGGGQKRKAMGGNGGQEGEPGAE